MPNILLADPVTGRRPRGAAGWRHRLASLTVLTLLMAFFHGSPARAEELATSTPADRSLVVQAWLSGGAQVRVAAAVDLGDAGTAVHLAASVNLQAVPLPERRAVLCLDTATAFLQWGKYVQALDALRTAKLHAPEEARRTRTHRLVGELAMRCPASLRTAVSAFATATGAPA